MYSASNISLRVRENLILHDVSITLRPGVFTAVVGPNGAGKSSLLKIMAGEQLPTTGEVHVNGRDLNAYRADELSMLRSVMPQHANVQFAFSVEQIVSLGRHAHKSSQTTDEEVIREIMALTDSEKFRGRNFMTLSGGEKQRVQLARVLAQVWEETVHPRYILMDEPTSSLDIAQQQHIFHLAKQVCTRNIGVMAIVHDLNQAVQFADELYFLRDGRLVASGDAHEVFTKDTIEETFCCRVNIYYDPCNNCPFIVPERPAYDARVLKTPGAGIK
jgi:iron complex transport system ATP-binding protein